MDFRRHTLASNILTSTLQHYSMQPRVQEAPPGRLAQSVRLAALAVWQKSQKGVGIISGCSLQRKSQNPRAHCMFVSATG